MPFADLKETLLKGGIAYHHVRRYIAELSEHLDDLAAREREAGHDEQEALSRARARLGSDNELAAAMLERKQFRAWSARAPWAVFALTPPFLATAIGIPFIVPVILIGQYYGFLDMQAALPPQWFLDLASGSMLAADLIMMPLAAIVFVAIAQRQRLRLIWPLIATALLLIFVIYGDVQLLPRGQGNLSIEIAPIFMASSRKILAEHWPQTMAQYLLTLLPVLWLYRVRRRAA